MDRILVIERPHHVIIQRRNVPGPGFVTDPRTALPEILRAGLAAVDPVRRVAEALADDPAVADWGGASSGRTVLVAVGKAAGGMAEGALLVLGGAVDEGIVLTVEGTGRGSALPAAVELHRGGHPVPDASGEAAARRIADLVASLGPTDRLLVLLSGGGSALLTLPRDGLVLDDVRRTTEVLLGSGMPIEGVNLVRRHLERLKGGGLARLAGGARIVGLILSDVPGDRVEAVASGPLSDDGSHPRDAETLLRRRGLWDALPRAVRDHLVGRRREARSPASVRPAPGDALTIRVVGGGGLALEAAAAEAERRGYRPLILTRELRGEARDVGRGLARVGRAVRDGIGPVRAPACLLAAGETTVTVRGDGRGGRNQELALAAALALAGGQGVRVASLGTDGVDGPTDAAGGWADGKTAARGRAAGVDPADALRRNDAYTFLKAAGGLIVTGPTGTNVADLMVVLVEADGA